ncbi:MAG TPA: EAL domain-containing protein [Solirubrobacteraceae bacterium]|nr:EAL domain-containing protein [Solirubrobacteraceae bacterium]
MTIPKIGSQGEPASTTGRIELELEGEQPSAAARMELERQLKRLGETLKERTEDVVSGIVRRNEESAVVLEPIVEESFVKVGTVSTMAFARWMAGEGAEVAREVGQESWNIFGQLAAQRAAPLNEVTKRCLRWRDAAADAIDEIGAQLELSETALDRALSMLQRSLDVTLVRMCQSFEAERRRAHEELHRRQEELAFMATHDALTGLPNRTLILDRVEQMLVRARRNQTPVAALFVDLDNFKHINDTLGHGVGDQLLRAVAARLEAVVRDIDALGRLGGDEFVVVAEGMSLAAGPELIAERLLGALKQPFKLKGAENTRLVVTASVGVAMGDRATAEELLRDADIAMYRAKWDGKNGYVVFESGMQDAVQSRMELEMDLRDAFEKDEFFVVYQPTFNLREMVPTGMEALIRWRHPTRGVVQPDDFVPLLEETGLIVEVGRWVLREACRQGAEWRQAGREIGIAVNVAARQLDRDEFVQEVRDALSDSGLEPEQLTIEITETTIMANAEETAGRLASIKEIGVRVAIDDFGTGYSSLAYLQRFPVDALKIDRSFISKMSNDVEGETLIRTLVQLGKSLSIETLAEGIEQAQELSLLREESCDTGQGFLFAHPLDMDECETFLENWAGAVSSTSASAERPPA